jgi:hypothetical protein
MLPSTSTTRWSGHAWGERVEQLHLVGLTTDLEGLIFSVRKGSKSGSFIVPLDDQLVTTIIELLRRRETPAGEQAARVLSQAVGGMRLSRPESILSPREIQARLRAGRSIAEVAREAGVDSGWIERFAGPIRAEQIRVLEQALALTYTKPRRGESAQPLGKAVLWNLAELGVELTAEEIKMAWSAFQDDEGAWMIRFRYVDPEGDEQVAEWGFDPSENCLTSHNRLAWQLGYAEMAAKAEELPEEPEAAAPDKMTSS